jgi:hypothetical protein
MDKVVKHAAASDNKIIPLTRFDLNISSGIIYTIKEHDIKDVIIGLHHKVQTEETFYGPVVERIVHRTLNTIFLYKAHQPVNTLKRMIVAVPQNAEYEKGFQHWFQRLYVITKETGLAMHIYADGKTTGCIKQLNDQKEAPVEIEFTLFENWNEFLIFSREVDKNDLFIIVSSRKSYLSYSKELERMPYYLTKYFNDNSFIIIYPEQAAGTANEEVHFDSALASNV